MKNSLVIAIIIAVVVGLGAFYGGMKYQQNKMSNLRGRFPGITQGQNGEQRTGQGLRPVSGTIISQDENSVTVKLVDESSKIILFTESSLINKTEEGSKEDLTEGTEITVFGQENDDGSLTAQNIQIGTGMFKRVEEQ